MSEFSHLNELEEGLEHALLNNNPHSVAHHLMVYAMTLEEASPNEPRGSMLLSRVILDGLKLMHGGMYHKVDESIEYLRRRSLLR